MKKRMLRGILVLLLLAIFGAAGAGAETSRKLTLMIYMCGSNLESHYGSASADIREMLDAGLGSREITVLVMTGGSDVRGESGYFQTDSTGIYELGNGRIRRIWQSDSPMNMGEQETLEGLLRYGMENRPAEKYALILWDHGGGPLEGVCWDETHEMDHLSMSELTGSLEAVTKNGKLSWIGFDACLMGSLEVAGQMAAYADYMIASQETEPSFGWNYAFLRDLDKDADGAETGRRIVDAFFEGREDCREILTLACIDLGAVQEAIRALDPVFMPIEQRLGREQFVALSGLRMNTTGFGKAEPSVSTSGYDLVDIRDLVTRMEETEASDRLLEQLDRAVVYSRANEDGACGLSLYHPYANKESYQEKWKDTYGALSFSAGYQQYVASFGGMLTGETMFRWLDLFARAEAPGENGNYRFEMDLTPEQAENAVSAQLMILRDTMGSQLENHCVLIAACPAEIGEDGILRAEWDGRSLYAEKEDGSTVGPVPFLQTNDGKENTVIGYYVPEGNYELDGQTVLFELDPEDRKEYPEIRRIRVWDEVTRSFSSRMVFSEEGYGALMFYNYHRSFPQIGADQTLPDYQTWADGEGVFASTVTLPDTWRFRLLRQESGESLYAFFRLVDSQQNVVLSLPADVPNEYRRPLKPVSGGVDRDPFHAEMYCTANTSQDQFGLQMEWKLENRGDEKVSIRIEQLTLNGTRLSDMIIFSVVEPGRTDLETKSFDRYDTAWLDRLESISGVLKLKWESREETEDIPFTFLFDSCDLDPLDRMAEPLAEAERNGVRMKLLSMEPDLECGWDCRIYMENGSDTEIKGWNKVLANGIHVGDLEIRALPPGCSRISLLNVPNLVLANNFLIPGLPSYALTYPESNLLQSLGEEEIRELSLVSEGEMHETIRMDFIPDSPVPVGEKRVSREADLLIPVVRPPETLSDPSRTGLPILRENNLYRILLRRVIAGDGEIALSLEAVNDSDLWVELASGDCAVNGLPVNPDLSFLSLPPHSRTIECVLLKGEVLENAGTEVRKLSLCFHDKNREWDAVPCLLSVQEPLRMGETDWRNGEEFTGKTIRGTEVNLEKEVNPIPVEPMLRIPENAASFRKTVEADLSPEERAEIRSAKISLVRPSVGNYMEVLTLQDWKPDQSDRFVFTHFGLLPTLTGNDQAGVWTYLIEGERNIDALVASAVDLVTKDLATIMMDEIRWTFFPEENRAEITVSEPSTGPFAYQSDLVTGNILPLEVLVEPDENGVLPHIGNMERRSGLEQYMNRPGTVLHGKPLQFALRPVTEEDDAYFLVSVSLKDGSSYSLPLIPFF